EPIEEFIQQARRAEQPYFLWYAPFLPHTPHNPPTALQNKYRPLAPSDAIAKYWAMCEWFDQTVGQLREIIRTQGDPQNTLIVFVCDNGWINLMDRSAYAPKSKRSQYDGGLRTPIMIHWPGKVAARRNDVDLASSIDLLPTVLALLGAESDPRLPGIDISNPRAVAGREAIMGEIFEHDIQSMDQAEASLRYRWVIEKQLKLIAPHSSRVPDGVFELYDLAQDPWEENNLAAQLPDQVQRLSARLQRWWPQQGK
ncbi:MAG: sulfatase-like hydrolase/transferase, partial [Planctomycetales bacterium]|nr:sulfatase-like hydrolase/transferase [Planctomycetales bacterium]